MRVHRNIKELTYKLQQSGQFDDAEEILLNIYNQQNLTHINSQWLQ